MSKYLVILHDAQDSSQVGRAELKLRLTQDLGVSESTVLRLLESLPVIIRRDLDYPVAKRYADTLEGLGAVVEAIEQVDGVTDDLLGATFSVEKSESGAEKLSSSMELGDLTLAPEESDDLSDLESMLESALHGSAETEAVEPQPLEAEKDDGQQKTILRFEDEPEDEEVPVAETHAGGEILLQMLTETAVPVETEAEQACPAPQSEPEAKEINIEAAFKRLPVAEPEQASKPTKRSALPKLLGVAFGLVVLVLAPLAFMSGGGQMSVISIDVEALLRQQKSILEGEAAPVVVERRVTGQWLGEKKDGETNVKVRLVEINDELARGSFEAGLPQPTKLTEQEIVGGVPPRLWLRRVEATNLKRIDSAEGEFAFNGPARVFLEEGDNTERVLAEVEFRLKKTEAGELSGSWVLRRNHSQGEEPVARRIAKNDIEFFQKGSLSAQKVAAPAPEPMRGKKEAVVPQSKAAK